MNNNNNFHFITNNKNKNTMGKYKVIHEDIEHIDKEKVAKRTQLSLIAIVLIVLGVAMLIAGAAFEDPNSSLPSTLFIVGAVILLAGIIKFFVSRSCYVYLPTKSRLKLHTVYYDVKVSDDVQNGLSMKRFDDLTRLQQQKDNGVKVETMLSADGEFAATQVLEYVPYTFEAITPVMCFYGEDARKLKAALKI